MTIPVLFVLDSSGSMAGKKINAVNEAMDALKSVFDSIGEHYSVRVGVMSFSSGSRWHTDGLIDINEFMFEPLTAEGLTELGAAIEEIRKRLVRSDLLSDIEGQTSKPIIVFMSDGVPTDNWEDLLQRAEKENLWFHRAARISIGVGEDAEPSVLVTLEGTQKNMDSDNFHAYSYDLLRATNAAEIKEYLEHVFRYSVLDGYSTLTDDPLIKAKRIKDNIKACVSPNDNWA